MQTQQIFNVDDYCSMVNHMYLCKGEVPSQSDIMFRQFEKLSNEEKIKLLTSLKPLMSTIFNALANSSLEGYGYKTELRSHLSLFLRFIDCIKLTNEELAFLLKRINQLAYKLKHSGGNENHVNWMLEILMDRYDPIVMLEIGFSVKNNFNYITAGLFNYAISFIAKLDKQDKKRNKAIDIMLEYLTTDLWGKYYFRLNSFCNLLSAETINDLFLWACEVFEDVEDRALNTDEFPSFTFHFVEWCATNSPSSIKSNKVELLLKNLMELSNRASSIYLLNATVMSLHANKLIPESIDKEIKTWVEEILSEEQPPPKDVSKIGFFSKSDSPAILQYTENPKEEKIQSQKSKSTLMEFVNCCHEVVKMDREKLNDRLVKLDLLCAKVNELSMKHKTAIDYEFSILINFLQKHQDKLIFGIGEKSSNILISLLPLMSDLQLKKMHDEFIDCVKKHDLESVYNCEEVLENSLVRFEDPNMQKKCLTLWVNTWRTMDARNSKDILKIASIILKMSDQVSLKSYAKVILNEMSSENTCPFMNDDTLNNIISYI